MDLNDRIPSISGTINGTGNACVDLTPNIKHAISALAPGESLEVISDDRAARVGVPAWCRLTGHELTHVDELDDIRTRFVIKHK